MRSWINRLAAYGKVLAAALQLCSASACLHCCLAPTVQAEPVPSKFAASRTASGQAAWRQSKELQAQVQVV